MSPIRGRTMKEYEEQLSHLKKENFNLKLRIYFLEERMGHVSGHEDREEAIQKNIELKVETETLRKEVSDKQDLLCQAAQALDLLEDQHQEQLNRFQEERDLEKGILETRVQELEKELVEYEQNAEKRYPRLEESAALYAQAFDLVVPPTCINHHTHEEVLQLQQRIQDLEGQVEQLECNLKEENERTCQLEADLQDAQHEVNRGGVQRAGLETELAKRDGRIGELIQELELKGHDLANSRHRIRTLEEALSAKEPEIQIKVQELSERDRIIEEKQSQIDQQNKVLVEIQITLDEKQRQIETLRSSLADRDNLIANLESKLAKAEANARNLEARLEASQHEAGRLRDEADNLRQQRRSRGRDLSDLDVNITRRISNNIIRNTENDRESKAKKEERDAARKAELKEKLDQLKAMEEKDKEKEEKLQEMQKIMKEKDEKLKNTEDNFNKACNGIQSMHNKVKEMNHEVDQLRSEVKRKDRKIRDLTGELNEVKDMFNKAKWEAKQTGGFDDVKDMTEEENERLWAELEDKNKKLNQVTEERDALCLEMEKQVQAMLTSLKDKESTLEEYEKKVANYSADVEARDNRIHDLEEKIAVLKEEAHLLKSVKAGQEEICRQVDETGDKQSIDETKQELARTTQELEDKKREIEQLNIELKKRTYNLQELVNKELWDKNKEIEKLQDKLSTICEKKELEIMTLQQQIAARDMQLNMLQDKVTELGIHVNLPSALIKEMKCALAADVFPHVQPITFNQHVSHIHMPSGDARETLSHEESPNDEVMTNQSAQHFKSEIHSLKQQLQSSMEERKYLCRKVEELKDKIRNTPERENDNKIQTLKAELARCKEELQKVKSKNRDEETCDKEPDNHHRELDLLKSELEKVRCKSDTDTCAFRDTIEKYQQETVNLRRGLTESGTACSILRGRLEELAGFLENVLNRRELSGLAPRRRQALQQAVDKSRELSKSLLFSFANSFSYNQSLSVSQDPCQFQLTTFSGDFTGNDGVGLSSSSQYSSLSLHEADGVDTWEDSTSGDKVGEGCDAGAGVTEREELKNEENRDITVTPDLSHSSVLFQLNEEIEKKSKELEDQAQKLGNITMELNDRCRKLKELDNLVEQKNAVMADQTQLISKLRSQVETLLHEVRQRDIELSHTNTEASKSVMAESRKFLPVVATSEVSGFGVANCGEGGLSPGFPSDVCLSRNSSASMKTIWKAEDVHRSPSSGSCRSPVVLSCIKVDENQRHSNPSLSSMTFYNSQLGDKKYSAQRVDKRCRTPENFQAANAVQTTACVMRSAFIQSAICPGTLESHSVTTVKHEQKLQRSVSEVSYKSLYEHLGRPKEGLDKRSLKILRKMRRSSSANTLFVPYRSNVDQGSVSMQQAHGAASHSESEAWSEPDRNVSMARIGLIQDSLLAVDKTPNIRPRVVRSQGLDESSDSEKSLHENRTPGKRARSELTEVRRIQNKLRCVEQVNEALRAELHIYQSLKSQMGLRDKPDTRDISVNTTRVLSEVKLDKSTSAEFIVENGSSVTVPASLLEEIRYQREKLESSLIHNEFIRRQLEGVFTGITGGKNEENMKHLCRRIKETTEQLEEAQLKCLEFENKLQGVSSQLEESQEKLKSAAAYQDKYHVARKTIKILQEQVSSLEIQIQEKDNEILEKQCVILELHNKIKEREVKNLETERRNREMEDRLSDWEERIKVQDTTVTTLQRSVITKDEEVEHWKLKCEEALKDCEGKYQSQLRELQVQVNNKTVQNTEVSLERSKLMSEKTRLENDVQAQESQISVLIREKKEAENELLVCKIRMKTAEDLEAQILNLENEKSNYEQQLKTLNDLKVENDELTGKVLMLERKVERYQLYLAQRRRKKSEASSDSREQQHSQDVHRFSHTTAGPSATSLSSQPDAVSPGSCSSLDFFRTDGLLRSPTSSEAAKKRPDLSKENDLSSGTSSLHLLSRQRSEMSDYVSDQTLEEFEATFNQSYSSYWVSVPQAGVDAAVRNIYSSPDLGIESDTGRLSSLDPPLQVTQSDPVQSTRRDAGKTLLSSNQSRNNNSEVRGNSPGNSDSETVILLRENSELKERLKKTYKALEATLSQLAMANQRKEQVERAICRQLHKTHHILKKARVNLETGVLKEQSDTGSVQDGSESK